MQTTYIIYKLYDTQPAPPAGPAPPASRAVRGRVLAAAGVTPHAAATLTQGLGARLRCTYKYVRGAEASAAANGLL